MRSRIVKSTVALFLAALILPLTATAASADGGDSKLGPPRCCV